jgi:hypothetical protein
MNRGKSLEKTAIKYEIYQSSDFSYYSERNSRYIVILLQTESLSLAFISFRSYVYSTLKHDKCDIHTVIGN